MALGTNRRDPEILNAIFRAAHSIKGGSGTFGFTQLSEATHEMETLFDALRKGQGQADDATIRLLLDACDVFKAHLARLQARRPGRRSLDGGGARAAGRVPDVRRWRGACGGDGSGAGGAGGRVPIDPCATGRRGRGRRRATRARGSARGLRRHPRRPRCGRDPSRGDEPLPRRASRGARIRPSARVLRARGDPRAPGQRGLRPVRRDRGAAGEIRPVRRRARGAGARPGGGRPRDGAGGGAGQRGAARARAPAASSPRSA